MNVLRELIDEPDVGWLVILIVLLIWIGSKTMARRMYLQSPAHRLAVGVFVLYCSYALYAFTPHRAEELVWIVIRALLASGIALGVGYIVLPIVDFLFRESMAQVREWQRSASHKLADKRREREASLAIQREREQYERLAPERERARQEAAVQAQTRALARKRRADARAHCDFLYHLYCPEIETRFPRRIFEDFIEKYLNDELSSDEVEIHAERLRKLIESHMMKADSRSPFKTLRDLTDWYEGQKTQVDAMPAGSLKSSLVALLNARYAELSFQVLEEFTS
jgi:hypothetical protein